MANHLHKNARVVIYAGKDWMKNPLPRMPAVSPQDNCCAGCLCTKDPSGKKVKSRADTHVCVCVCVCVYS